MRTLSILAVALTLGACVPTSSFKPHEVTGAATGDLTPGSRVGARQDGTLMLAEVVRVEGDAYVVKFANRVTASVKKSDILPVAAPGSLKTGDRVLAPQQETKLWQADVVRVDGATAVVVFDSHTEEVQVPADRVAHLPPGFCDPLAGCRGSGATQKDTQGGKGVDAPKPADPLKAFQQSLKIGETALFRAKELGTSNHYEWRVATVTGRMGDALVVKVTGESETRNAFSDDLRPARALKRPLEPGRRALWPDAAGRSVEIWVAQPPADDGTVEVIVHRNPKARGGDGGDPVTLTKAQVATLTAMEGDDLLGHMNARRPLTVAVGLAFLGAATHCTRPERPRPAPRDEPAAASSEAPPPHVPPTCVPLTAKQKSFFAGIVPAAVDYDQPRCGLREIDNWEWTRCGNNAFFVFAQPEATTLRAVYDAKGELVGVQGQITTATGEFCEGLKPAGPCEAFVCGHGAPGAPRARKR